MKCREVTLNYERSQFDEVPLAKRLLMRLHLLYCQKCNRYIVDSKLIDKLIKSTPEAKLTRDEKEQLLTRLI